MVKISALSLFAASAAAVAVVRSDVTPANMLMQAVQELPLAESSGSCGVPRKTQLRFYNGCSGPVHIWRQDSSVDKATVLPAGGVYGEPIRQDWRSGLTGFRVSQDGMSPYNGRPTGMLSQWLSIHPDGASWNGHTYNVLGDDKENIIVGWGVGIGITCGGKEGDAAEPKSVEAKESKDFNSNTSQNRNFRWNMALTCPEGYPKVLSSSASGSVYLCTVPKDHDLN